MIRSTLKWLYLKLWKEPKDIRGVWWTVCFWGSLISAIGCLTVLTKTREGAVALLCFVVWKFALDHASAKPKRLGRQLPYRRRR